MSLSPRLGSALAGIAALSVAVPAWVVSHPPHIARSVASRIASALPPRRIVPQAELPPVEPVTFVKLAPDDARAFNATVPFSTDPNPAARPFRYVGSDQDRARAVDCLAAGVFYEAGDDVVGERAVAQVILNRLRHPAFPKTVCGVVFEGSQRTTGCQFTFTCDGALTRWKPPEAGWLRAREIATLALTGAVYRPVGHATHYHTDWVVPYWQSSLDKVARVGTHLFFRWSGWWGTPPAFNRGLVPGEPVIDALAAIAPSHARGSVVADADAAILAALTYVGPVPLPLASDPDKFVVVLDAKAQPESYAALALAACGDRARCMVMGWIDKAMLPITPDPQPAQQDAMTFSYLRDRAGGLERSLWNCTIIPREVRTECMKRSPVAGATPISVESGAIDPLTGVRRRGDVTVPAPTPTPTPTATPKAGFFGPAKPSRPVSF